MAALRKLVWTEHDRFRGWVCSECAWVFSASYALTGTSLAEMKQIFESQRDKEFASHVCAKHPRAKSQSTKRDVKQDWEKLYRAAIAESDRSKLLQRVEDAEGVILERSRSLSKSPASGGKEQDAMTRALYILTLLRAKAGD